MTPLGLLAPDQRAALELVLRQGRSYGELSEILAIPERDVRDRAEAAVQALAGRPGDGAVDTGRIADWLLGQQNERAAAATAERVAAHEPSRLWAAAAAEQLREVGGDRVPAVRVRAVPPPRPRPLRNRKPAATPAAPSVPPVAPSTDPAVSRLGGAILIAVVVLVLVAVLVWPVNLLGIGGDDTAPTAASGAAATPTPTPTSVASQATGNDIVLRGVGGTKAEGLMRLFKAQGGGVQFAIGAQGLPNNRKNEFYAVWLTSRKAKPRLLGFPQAQVTSGVLTVGGPGKADEAKFPRWFATYEKVLITRETKAKPAEPGAAVLEGTLPAGQARG